MSTDTHRGAAVITGAGRQDGIGFATAKALAELGWALVVSDLRFDIDLNELSARVPACSFAADVSDSAAVEDLADFAIDRFGMIGVWVNNAGTVVGSGPITQVTDDDWATSLAVNAGGCFYGCRAALRRMLANEAPRGRIVNVASQAGKTGPPHLGPYAAAKAAVIALTQSAAAEVGDRGITVNAVCPGTVATSMLEQHGGIWEIVAKLYGISVEHARSRASRRIPIGRLVEPREVASMIAYLCSDAASAITGIAVNVAGGEEMH